MTNYAARAKSQAEIIQNFNWIAEKIKGVSPDVILQAAIEMEKIKALIKISDKIDDVADKIDNFTSQNHSINVRLKPSDGEPINFEVSQPIKVDIDS